MQIEIQDNQGNKRMVDYDEYVKECKKVFDVSDFKPGEWATLITQAARECVSKPPLLGIYFQGKDGNFRRPEEHEKYLRGKSKSDFDF